MNTHDIDIELPPLPTPPSLIQRKDWYGAIQAYARSYGMECARAAIEADRKLHPEVGKNAKKRFESAMKGCKETDPIERLRFYCSLAMSGQDWLDVEPFFDALVADRKRRGEPVHLFRRRGQPSGDFVTCSLERYAELSAMQDKFDTMIAYTAPQPAEPDRGAPVPKGWKLVPETPTSKQIVHMALQIKGADADGWFRTDGDDWPEHVDAAERAYKWALSEAPQPAEPVKVPSNTDIDELSREWGLQSAAYPSKSMVRDFARTLLARYTTTKEQP